MNRVGEMMVILVLGLSEKVTNELGWVENSVARGDSSSNEDVVANSDFSADSDSAFSRR